MSSADVLGNIVDLLGIFRMAVAQLRLYPRESPQVVKTVAAAGEALLAYLKKEDALVVAQTAEGLVVNGKPVRAKDAAGAAIEASLRGLLQEAKIRSLKIPRGFTPDELGLFLQGLSVRFWDLQNGAAINQRLDELGVRTLRVDEIEYREVGKNDLLLKDAAGRLGSDPAAAARTLEDLLEASAADGSAPGTRLELVLKLLNQDPSLLPQVHALEPSAGLLRDAQGLVGFDQMIAALKGLATALPSMPEYTRLPVSKTAEALWEGFRPYTRLRAQMAAAAAGLPVLLIPPWLGEVPEGGPPEPASVHRAKTILGFSAAARAEAIGREGRDLVMALLAEGHQELAENVLGSLGESLTQGKDVDRRYAADSLLSLRETLENPKLEKARAALEAKVRGALDDEKDPRAYGKLTELAGSLADARLKKGEVNEALKLLDVLKRHSVIKDNAFPERQRLVLPALDKVTSGEGYKTVAGVVQGQKDMSSGLQEAIDRAAVAFLLGQIKTIDSLAERLRVAEAALKAGPWGAQFLADEIFRTRSPMEVLRLMEVLPYVTPQPMAEVTLTRLLREHPVMSVRRRAGALLCERGFENAEKILTGELEKEKDPAARAALVGALGSLKTEDGWTLVADVARSRQEPEEVRVAACQALGRTRKAEARDVLAEIATHVSKGLTSLFRSTPTAVRVAAVKALAGFLQDPFGYETLAAAARDADLEVRHAALAVLEAPSKARETPLPPPPAEQKDGGGLFGMLKDIPLDQLVQTIGGSSGTGLLKINVEADEGVISFVNGQIADIRFRRETGQAAFNAMMALRRGAFVFRSGDRPSVVSALEPVQKYLLEASRVMDESGLSS